MLSPSPRLRLTAWRLRLPIAALLLGCACAVVVGQLRPAPEATRPVLVASRGLAAGTTLRAHDVRVEHWPSRFAPSGATRDDMLGRAVAVAVPAGFPLAESLLASTHLGADAPPGSVVAPVRLSDPAVAALLRPGDRVDVLALPLDDATAAEARRVARAALVLAGPTTPGGTDDSKGLLGSTADDKGTLTLLAVSPAEARALAAVATSGVISALLVE